MLNANYLHLKVVVLGNECSGKTSICQRFCDNEYFDVTLPTIGANYNLKTITYKNNTIDLSIWNFSSHKKFLKMTEVYRKNVDIVLVVFDTNDIYSFENILEWIDLGQEENPNNIAIIVVCNKIDLDNRLITENMAQKMCDKINVPLVCCSAKTGKGVYDVFECAVSQICDNHQRMEIYQKKLMKNESVMKNKFENQFESQQNHFLCKIVMVNL
ncbi:hypothetical protein EIN_280860 [Entamoeba invadens IP1]|uniref:Uncharacterized protein n=1 Tax=Entamoeba invadens IP1 TaxID=370355 RepID=A0A0A1U7V1_ENTIV|nr:hypothetical protein EIN_280860 [Entamoeba invadens IP1]ELP91009.1 hypothetical protein EIN_280860 [Entamoeba invadens IP1]|eukprot:XP_004257780.1 hypothetical protein EIN_280860 [Entamoeba invadens IP1]